MKKIFWTLMLLFGCITQTWADGPFRTARYDGFKVLQPKEGGILMIGNSITDQHIWNEVFRDAQGNCLPISNRGNSGSYATEQSENLESYLAKQPAKVFMMIGTNDIATSGGLSTPSTPAVLLSYVQSIVNRIHKRCPDAQVYLYPIINNNTSNRVQATWLSYNTLLKNWITNDVNASWLTFIDFYDAMTNVASGGSWSNDKLHPNAAAYKNWCDAILQYMPTGTTCSYDAIDGDLTATQTQTGVAANMNGARATMFSVMPIKSKDILVFGDGDIKTHEWWELLGNTNVLNRGTGWGSGGSISMTSALVDNTWANSTKKTIEYPKAIFLYTGTDDCVGKNNDGSYKYDTTAVKTNYKALVEKIVAKVTDAKNATATKVYLMALHPNTSATENTNRITVLNAYIKTLADADANDKIEFVDTYTPLASDGVANSTYVLSSNFLSGKGAVKFANLMAAAYNEDFPSDKLTAISEDDGNANYTIATKRNTIGTAITAGRDVKNGTKVGEYTANAVATFQAAETAAFNVLAQSTITDAEVTSTVANLKAGLTVIAPTSENTANKYFRLSTPNRGNNYLTNNGVGQTMTGTSLSIYDNQVWKLQWRSDETFDLVSVYDNAYITPSPFSVTATAPSTGWTFADSNTTGLFIISSGTNQIHLLTSGNITNWGGGSRKDDAGCDFKIEEIEEGTFSHPVVEDGHYYTIAGYIARNGGTTNYVYYDGTTRSMSSTVPTDNKGVWKAVKSGSGWKFQSMATTDAAYLTYDGADATGAVYTITEGVSEGCVSMRPGNSYYSASSEAGVMGGNMKSSSNKVQGDYNWSTDWKITETEYEEPTPDELEITVSSTTGTGVASGSFTKTWTANGSYAATLGASASNLTLDGTNIKMYTGTAKSSTYTITAPEGYYVAAYSFTLSNGNSTEMTFTPAGKDAITCAAGTTAVSVTDLTASTTTFVLAASSNIAATAQNFKIVLYKDGYIPSNEPVLVTALSQLKGGEYVVLKTPATNGNNAPTTPYFNGTTAKTANLEYANVYVLEAATNGYRLKNVSTEKYVAPATSTGEVIAADVATAADAEVFTLTTPIESFTTGYVDGTVASTLIRFTATKNSKTTYINAQGDNAAAKYADGTGSWSVWNVYTLTQKMVDELNPNTPQPTPAYTCPFEPTDDVTSEDTQWYIMKIGSGGVQVIGDTEKITLGGYHTQKADIEQWAASGNDTDGYTLYNKAFPGYVLAASTTMSGTTGSGTYPHMVLASEVGDLCSKWQFVSSDKISGADGWYMYEKGYESNKINNRNGVLAFWNGGADAGSTIVLTTIEDAEIDSTCYVFDNGGSIPYRIPAICTAKDGVLVAAADYRFTKADIGGGRLDLHIRTSNDNGQTWNDIITPEQMTGDGDTTEGNQKCGYGDPCLIADRATGKIMLTSCSGTPGFFGGTRTHHQGWAQWYSTDNGQTWTEPRYLDEEFLYSKFDNSKFGQVRGWFVGSGKIHQSRYTKVGDYYRLYLAGSTCSVGSNYTANWVLYSDDFGQTWDFLGGCDETPVRNGDEVKCEELPNGNVLVSSRNVSGRYYNIFSFRNMERAEGSWGEQALSSSSVNGLTANNGCNGEVGIYPVIRKSDGAHTWIALQSLPIDGRTKVSIFYKDLGDASTYASTTNFAKDWTKGIQVSDKSSAYSTWSMCNDHTLAFIYEENGGNGGYDIVYKNISIEQATNNLYEYDTTIDAGQLGEQILLDQAWAKVKYDGNAAYNANTTYIVGDKMITDSAQITSPYTSSAEGSIAALIDEDATTHWHSDYSAGAQADGTHYLVVDAGEGKSFTKGLQINVTRRAAANDHVKQFTIYGSDAAEGTYTQLAVVDIPNATSGAVVEAYTHIGEGAYRYLKFVATVTSNTRGYFHMAEFQVRPRNLDLACPNVVNAEAAATFAAALAEAESVTVPTQENINTLRDAYNTYLRVDGPLTPSISAAQAALSMTGIGYPKADAAARTTLQNAITTAQNYDMASASSAELTAAIATLNAATETYKGSSDEIQMPEDGKAYYISIYKKGETAHWNVKADGTLNDGSAFGGVFVAKKFVSNGHYRYAFVGNADGKFLEKGTVSAAYTTDYAYNDFEVGALNARKDNGYMTGSTADERFGYLYMTADARPGNAGAAASLIVKEATGAFDNSKEPYFNGTFTSAIKFTEVAETVSETASAAISTFATSNLSTYTVSVSKPEAIKTTCGLTVDGDIYDHASTVLLKSTPAPNADAYVTVEQEYYEATVEFDNTAKAATVTYEAPVFDALKTYVPLPTKTTSDIPYRIPAIGQAHNGDVIAVADYRYSRSDIGMANNGKIDLKYRIQNHETGLWGNIRTLAAAEGTAAMGKYGSGKLDSLHFAYGDPCIVCDINSNDVVVTSCSGNVSFPKGTRTCHQGWAYFLSHDNGQTWEDVKDISDQIFEQFDEREGSIKCMFIGSGKISQSPSVKVGTHNRIYCAGLVKLGNGSNTAWTFYSDDFGLTWKVLGGVQNIPITSADEPKSEELPDGSILLSSRIASGRRYNIYHFTNVETGEGYWENEVAVTNVENGYTASSNACNGETLVVPVTKKSDSSKTYLLLQSVPFGPSNRSNVGINYKELTDFNDFRLPSMLNAASWDGKYQVSTLGSAYSTMCQNNVNGNVEFLYEEETYCGSGGGGYSIVYKSIPVDTLTNGLYEYRTPSAEDLKAYLSAGFTPYYNTISSEVGPNVGQIPEAQKTALDGLKDAYVANPTSANYCAYNAAYKNGRNTVTAGQVYKIKYSDPTGYVFTTGEKSLYATASDTNLKWGATSEDSPAYYWYVSQQADGKYAIRNVATGQYIGLGGGTSGTVAMSKTAYNAISMTGAQGEFYLKSSGGQPFHCGGHGGGSGTGGYIVGWSNGWNTWNVLPIAEANAQTLQNTAYDAMYALTSTLTYDVYDCVGAPSKAAADALSALNVARGESEDVTADKLQALQDAYYAYYASIQQPEAGKYYRLNNVSYTSNYAYTTGSSIKAGAKSAEDVSLFKFEDAGSGNFYLITNDGKSVQVAATSTLVATAPAKVAYAVTNSAVGKFYMGATSSTNNYRFLHNAGGNDIVGWETSATATLWKLEEVADDNIWTVSLTQPEGCTDSVAVTLSKTGYTGIATAKNGGFYKLAEAPAVADFTSGTQYWNATVTVNAETKTIAATFQLDASAFGALKESALTCLAEPNGVGYRSVAAHNTLQAAYNAALQVESATVADVVALNTAINTYKNSAIQMPVAGRYYTIKGKYSNSYITSTNNSSSQAQLASTLDNTAVFQYDGTHLTSYATGFRLGKATWGMSTTADEDLKIAFETGVNFGYLTVKCTNSGNSATMYDSGTYVNRQGSKDNGGRTDWQMTEVIPHAISAVGYATFSADIDVTIPEGVTAYYVTADNGATVHLEPLEDVIPANTGAILQGAAATYLIQQDNSHPAAVEGNLLKAAVVATNIEAEEGKTAYIFSNGSKGVGFYKMSSNNAIGAHKCWLELDTRSDVAQFLAFSFDEATGLSEMNAESSEQKADGKYLENGQFIIVKNGQIYNATGQVMK